MVSEEKDTAISKDNPVTANSKECYSLTTYIHTLYIRSKLIRIIHCIGL